MAGTYDIDTERERFTFDFEQKVLKRTVEGIMVSRDSVELHLSGNSTVRFRVDPNGRDIIIEVPDCIPGSLTLDTDGTVQ